MSRPLFAGMVTLDHSTDDDVWKAPNYYLLTINRGMEVQFWQIMRITQGAAEQFTADISRFRNKTHPRNSDVTVSLFPFNKLREGLASYSGEPEKRGAFHPDNPSLFWQAALIFRDFEAAANAPLEVAS